MATNFKFFLRLWVVANFLIFVYGISVRADSSVIAPFFWGYTLIVMITELKHERDLGFEELGATFLYGMFVSSVIIAFFGIIAFILALILLGDWSFTYLLFKKLISLSTLIAIVWLIKKSLN